MTNALKFDELSSELTKSGTDSTVRGKKGTEPVPHSVQILIEEVGNKIPETKTGTIQDVRPPKPLTLSWSLLCNTSYKLTKDSGKKSGYVGVCSVVIHEIEQERLDQ